jgi:iron complex transport system ATP-binding protein
MGQAMTRHGGIGPASANGAPLLACENVAVRVASRSLVEKLTFTVPRGSVTCMLGCNGAGKTLTLHTLAGLREPAAGTIAIEGKPLQQWPRRQLAQRLGLLPQTTEDAFPSTVMATALVGRHPHIGFWQWESDADRTRAREALSSVSLDDFQLRDLATLTGGERRRVAIAAMLTQNPDLLLLDEPVNHLDPHHQMEVLRLIRAKADAGHGVLMSLHDAGLAARFADQALLLFGNGEWLCGPSAEVLTEATISRLYGMPVMQLTWTHPDNSGRTFVAR